MGCLVPVVVIAVLFIFILVFPFATTESGPNNNWDDIPSLDILLEIDEISWIKINYVIPLQRDTYKVKYDLGTVTKWDKKERNELLEDLGLTARY